MLYGDEGLAEAATALESVLSVLRAVSENHEAAVFQSLPASLTLANAWTNLIRPASRCSARYIKLRASFLEKMDDDFNTGGAIADLFDLVRELNKYADQQKLDEIADVKDARITSFVAGARVLRELSNILGLFRSDPGTARRRR